MSSNTEAPDLVGTDWVLQDIHGQPVLEGVRATLAFTQPNQVAGNGSCNLFTGGVSLDQQPAVQFSQLAIAQMGCSADVNEQEDRFMASLQQVNRYEVQDRQLLLFVPGQRLPLRLLRRTA